VDAIIERHRDYIRAGEITKQNGQGGYSILGRMVEVRYELTEEHRPPKWLRDQADSMKGKLGLALDWGTTGKGPLLAQSRNEKALLIVSPIEPLAPVPDPEFTQQTFVTWNDNKIPLISIPPDMRKGLKNSDGSIVEGTDQPIKRPLLREPKFMDHCRGNVGPYLIVGPLTEGLIKLKGIYGLMKVFFQSDGVNAPALWLDPESAEGYFVGGKFNFSEQYR